MKVNKELLPIKAHYFILYGTVSSVLPFMMVVARQLGVPVGIQGTIAATITVTNVFAKPIISGIADYFPSARKSIFITLLMIIVVAIGPIGLLPPLYDPPAVRGSLLQATTGDLYLRSYDSGGCTVTVAWECSASCSLPGTCPLGNHTRKDLRLAIVHSEDTFLLNFNHNESEAFDVDEVMSYVDDSQVMRIPDYPREATALDAEDSYNKTLILDGTMRREENYYLVEGFPLMFDDYAFNISVGCAGGERSGRECLLPWMLPQFWLYVMLLLVGKIASSTCYSLSHAICCDTIGKDGNYGSQRAWGALSYGLLGILSGLLVDWCSGTSIVKDYTPAFLLMVVCGILDILLTAAYLRVPKAQNGSKVWAHILPLLHQPHFLMFLAFSFLVGFYDGLDTGYVFVLQEDMAVGSWVMQHMKLLQGTTMLVQAFSAVPFMFASDWFMKRMGAQKVISLVFFLYAFRLLGLALASALSAVWLTIAIELINGPCFGLGFTAIIVHAKNITPKGISNTVQGVVGVFYGTLGYAGASFIGGIGYEIVGGQTLYFMTGVAAFCTCLLHLVYLKFLPPTQDVKTADLETEVTENGLKAEPELLKDSPGSTHGLDMKSMKYILDVENGGKDIPRENNVERDVIGCRDGEGGTLLQNAPEVGEKCYAQDDKEDQLKDEISKGCGL